MPDYDVEFISSAIFEFIVHPILISIIAGILSEEFVLLLALLSGYGFVGIWKVAVFGFIGVIVHDVAVYWFGRLPVTRRFFKKFGQASHHQKKLGFIFRFLKQKYYLPLLLTKFVYGTRVAFIVYLSQKERNFWRYFLVNLIAVAIWFVIMVPLGWLAGQGFSHLLTIAKGIEKLFGLIVILIMLYFLVHKLVMRMLKRAKS